MEHKTGNSDSNPTTGDQDFAAIMAKMGHAPANQPATEQYKNINLPQYPNSAPQPAKAPGHDQNQKQNKPAE